MDADCIEERRDQLLSRREKRWSMNSQRLEEIVAELMKPISDVRRSFDTDLSALLEEYLTEAGLRALAAGAEASAADAVAPNYMELALLLQQSAALYGRKVDYLYQHVLDVSEALHACTHEAEAEAGGAQAGEAATPGARRRRRASSAGGAFAHIALAGAGAGARREAGGARPPPTLPRMFMELEPRVLTPADAQLLDYAAEPIGLLNDYQVMWRLHEGLLVDQLEDGTQSDESVRRPICLAELQAAIEAAVAAPAGAGASAPHSPSPPRSPLRASTPLPPAEPPPPARRERKRRSDVLGDNVSEASVKIVLEQDVREKLSAVQEFSISARWIKRVVAKRKSYILSERRRLRAEESPPSPGTTELADFGGWAGEPGAAGPVDSDDDGFFEQSSVGSSDASRVEEAGAAGAAGAGSAGSAAWAARVAARARAGEGADVRALGARVLGALPPAGAPRPFRRVLRAAARCERDVSRLLLATLFLANAGNVQISAGAALSVDSFSLRLLSSDERLYCAAAAAEPFMR